MQKLDNNTENLDLSVDTIKFNEIVSQSYEEGKELFSGEEIVSLIHTGLLEKETLTYLLKSGENKVVYAILGGEEVLKIDIEFLKKIIDEELGILLLKGSEYGSLDEKFLRNLATNEHLPFPLYERLFDGVRQLFQPQYVREDYRQKFIPLLESIFSNPQVVKLEDSDLEPFFSQHQGYFHTFLAHDDFSPELLLTIKNANNNSYPEEIFSHPNFPIEKLDELINDGKSKESPYLLKKAIVSHKDIGTYKAKETGENLLELILKELGEEMDHYDYQLLELALSNPNIPTKFLTQYASHKSSIIRIAIAGNSVTPKDILVEYLNDKNSKGVVMAALGNPNVPFEAVEKSLDEIFFTFFIETISENSQLINKSEKILKKLIGHYGYNFSPLLDLENISENYLQMSLAILLKWYPENLIEHKENFIQLINHPKVSQDDLKNIVELGNIDLNCEVLKRKGLSGDFRDYVLSSMIIGKLEEKQRVQRELEAEASIVAERIEATLAIIEEK